MPKTNTAQEGVNTIKDHCAKDVAILPVEKMISIIVNGGFESPVPFFQAGLMYGCFARKEISLPGF